MNEGLYLQGMTLLDFARGPAFRWAVAIFVFGVVWRLTAMLLASRKRYEPAKGSSTSGGIRTLLTRSAPPHELEKNIVFQHYSGYAWHISMFIVLLFFTPHMLFFKDILGFGWPTLPNLFITFFTVVTMGILLVLLARRLMNPVLRQISTMDDYFSWIVAFLPFLTGIMSFTHITFGMSYETVLALHILSICLLLVWFPFGKLMHALLIWPSRYKVGAAFGRRGVRA
jgi:nitrate reductase gamma subunit